METATEYLAVTEYAVRHLFDEMDSYCALPQFAVNPVFGSFYPSGPEQEAEYEALEIVHADSLVISRQAMQKFTAEYSALDALCGAVLQVADQTLSLYGKDAATPPEWSDVVSKGTARYCRGHLLREVPLGLVIPAARNQHAHFDDPAPHPLPVRVFGFLATAHGYPTSVPDDMYGLSNPSLMSFASNVTGLMKWPTFDQYETDMRALMDI